MKIPTLGTGLLYQVHRRKPELLLAMAKRKAFWLVIQILGLIAIATYLLIHK